MKKWFIELISKIAYIYGTVLFLVYCFFLVIGEGEVLVEIDTFYIPFLIALMLTIFALSIFELFRRFKNYYISKNNEFLSKSKLYKVEFHLRKKATSLRRLNLLLLLMIVSSLVIGMYIFISAEELARGDDTYQRASDKIIDTYYELNSIGSDHLSKIKRQEDLLKYELKEINKGIREKNKSLPVQDAGVPEMTIDNLIKSKLGEYTASVKELITEVKKHEEGRDALMNSLEKLQSSNTSTLVFVSTITNKIGSILILLFFVNIINNLYQYNSKLATFYESRADTLGAIENIEGIKYEKLITLMHPENINFEKNPSTPSKDFMNMFNKSIDKMVELKKQEGKDGVKT